MAEAVSIIEWLERLSKASFAITMGVILFGNFMGIWVWGKFHRERVTALEAELKEWKSMAMGLLTPLENQMRKRHD